MVSAAAALALITLTQRDYCELPIEPFLSVEDDVVAMRRLDPGVIELMPPAHHFIAANTYFDEYLGFQGHFPWLHPDQPMPVTPPNHLARPREPGSDSAVEWESISALMPDIDWPPDPYIRAGARFCMARAFHFHPARQTVAPATAPPPPPQNVTTLTLPPPPLYKLSGFVVLAFAIGILAGSALSNRLWWQWRNRRNRKNFQTLLADLAQQEANKTTLRHRASGGLPSAPHRLKKCISMQNPPGNDLRVQAGAATEQMFVDRAHALYWKYVLCVAQFYLDWRSRLLSKLCGVRSLISQRYSQMRRRLARLTAYPCKRRPPLIRLRRPHRCCPGAVNVSLGATSRKCDDSDEAFMETQSHKRRVIWQAVAVSLPRLLTTSKGCQTTGVKRVCASVQTPQALSSDEQPKRGGSIGGRGNHRTRRHNGNSARQELITDNSDLDEAQLRASPGSGPSTASTTICNRQSYDASPPPGFEGGWHDHDEFLQTCQKLLDNMDNWDAPSGYAATSTETASTLGENDTSQDIHSLLFALTGKMDAALLQNRQ